MDTTINALPENVSRFMPKIQQGIVARSDDFKDIITRLNSEIEEIPNKPENPSECEISSNGSQFNSLIVYAHFFYAGCDWFILDWDRENDILFCYAILNGDVEMSELGTSYLSDLTEHGRIELDFHWHKCSLAHALHHKYPDYFPNPSQEEPMNNQNESR